MTDSDTSSLVYSLIVLMMVASGLFARKLPFGQTVKYILIWIGIFAAGFVLFSFRGEAGALWQRLSADFDPSTPRSTDGTVRITKSQDGHFNVDSKVNGRSIRFLIDSGATRTALSVGAAQVSGVEVSPSGFPVSIDTANGSTTARRARITRLNVGPITREDFPVLVSESFGDVNLLGMDFLSSLKGWRVEGDTMILNP
jgi:aspartyl protease family protein